MDFYAELSRKRKGTYMLLAEYIGGGAEGHHRFSRIREIDFRYNQITYVTFEGLDHGATYSSLSCYCSDRLTREENIKAMKRYDKLRNLKPVALIKT